MKRLKCFLRIGLCVYLHSFLSGLTRVLRVIIGLINLFLIRFYILRFIYGARARGDAPLREAKNSLAFRYVRNSFFFFFFLFGVGLGDWENSNRNEETVVKKKNE